MLDSLNPSFVTLSSHSIVINPIENEYIREEMYLIHRYLCSAYRGKDNNPIALLLCYFACFTYHFNNIQRIALNANIVILILNLILN